ncbi:MAG: DNA-binding response regulator [Saprospirales bacterium]|nr:DNA-binding response regulator [Saprospirales bacterium]
MKISCLVIDDEPVARKGLALYVEQTPFLELVGTCKSALEATSILHEQEVELLFLDIQMPELSGIDFMKSLEQPPAVIFTTAYRDYAIEGFELNALDYLVKPISFQRFLKAANKAQSHFEMLRQQSPVAASERDDYFFIKSDGQFIRIRLENVLYFESEKDYVFIYTRQKRYLTLLSLKQLEKELPEDRFLRVHRSFIVSLDKVELMEGNQVVIADRKIPVSRTLQETIYNKLIAGRLWKRDM